MVAVPIGRDLVIELNDTKAASNELVEATCDVFQAQGLQAF